ncbi:MAG TPA: TlyA family RNA methyltransferase [Sumerlaeia bacterium]|nr:TlyA family RNA methyltransferase [Sumerlaeia bacterium]
MTQSKKRPLDQILVDRGLAPSMDKARRMIRAGQVRRGTDVLDKPGFRLDPTVPLQISDLGGPFVSRGGEKLGAAFDAFPGLSPCPAVCADIGASTGGFTDCLLQRGARRVYAIDVGAGQLDARLRADSRVVVMERTNARDLTPESLPELLDLAVIDVSFISLEMILPPVSRLLRPTAGQVVALVKPQFEARREQVEKGGVVRDPAVHEEAVRRIAFDAAPAAGLRPQGLILSPLKGPAGNREYLLWLANREAGAGREALVDEETVRRTVADALQCRRGTDESASG